MHTKKNKKILIYLFLFCIIGTLNNKNLSNFHFPKINQINISGLDNQENSEILKSLEVLKSDNLFFLDPKKIEKMINNISYIDEFYISKKYPTTLNVKIQKAKYMAYTIKDNKTFILGSNKKLIVASDMKKKLPYIYGDLEIEKFFDLKKDIERSNFEFDEVKNLFFFTSGRWDIETFSGVIIKLPRSMVDETLNFYVELIKKNDFKKIKTIDLRQKNQVIINE
tara:strand:+ start:918 stop:1589 length:672 start_codon:yes stop_codon:yes gene_type:complete